MATFKKFLRPVKSCCFFLFFCSLLGSLPTIEAVACTIFLLLKDGHQVFGRNYDWDLEDALIITKKRGLSKRSYASFKGQVYVWLFIKNTNEGQRGVSLLLTDLGIVWRMKTPKVFNRIGVFSVDPGKAVWRMQNPQHLNILVWKPMNGIFWYIMPQDADSLRLWSAALAGHHFFNLNGVKHERIRLIKRGTSVYGNPKGNMGAACSASSKRHLENAQLYVEESPSDPKFCG